RRGCDDDEPSSGATHFGRLTASMTLASKRELLRVSRCAAGGGFAPGKRLRRDRLNRVDDRGASRRPVRLRSLCPAVDAPKGPIASGGSPPRTEPTTSPTSRPPSRLLAAATRSSWACGSTSIAPVSHYNQCGGAAIHLVRAPGRPSRSTRERLIRLRKGFPDEPPGGIGMVPKSSGEY